MVGEVVGACGASLGGPCGAAKAHCCVAVDESRSSLADDPDGLSVVLAARFSIYLSIYPALPSALKTPRRVFWKTLGHCTSALRVTAATV